MFLGPIGAVSMKRPVVLFVVSTTIFALAGVSVAQAGSGGDRFQPGTPGIGDQYYPTDGNGGYDVQHYTLDVNYDPDTDRIAGHVTITAIATQNLSRFNLDLRGLRVRDVAVNGDRAAWRRSGDELIVTPSEGLTERGYPFVTRVTYLGVPRPLDELGIFLTGFVRTDDGVDVLGQPHVASTWFPVNDHPSDRALLTHSTSRFPRG